MDNEFIKGRFTKEEEEYIRSHYTTFTDKEIGKVLKRKPNAVTSKRVKMKLMNKQLKKQKKRVLKTDRQAYLGLMDDKSKRNYYEQEVTISGRFRSIQKTLDLDEADYYTEAFVDFMMDPSIETMTTMEKDTLHLMITAVIRKTRYMYDEKSDKNENADPDEEYYEKRKKARAAEISKCDETILKAQECLNVSRKQRLKDGNDQSQTFTNLIKDLKNPNLKMQFGREGAVFRYMAQLKYNHMIEDGSIQSGRSSKFDIAKNFKDGQKRKGASSEFLPKSVEEK